MIKAVRIILSGKTCLDPNGIQILVFLFPKPTFHALDQLTVNLMFKQFTTSNGKYLAETVEFFENRTQGSQDFHYRLKVTNDHITLVSSNCLVTKTNEPWFF